MPIHRQTYGEVRHVLGVLVHVESAIVSSAVSKRRNVRPPARLGLQLKLRRPGDEAEPVKKGTGEDSTAKTAQRGTGAAAASRRGHYPHVVEFLLGMSVAMESAARGNLAWPPRSVRQAADEPCAQLIAEKGRYSQPAVLSKLITVRLGVGQHGRRDPPVIGFVETYAWFFPPANEPIEAKGEHGLRPTEMVPRQPLNRH
jgi:hypothetical protein